MAQSLRSLWYYHQDVYTFHTHFLNCSTHPYASKPSGWLLLNRPVGVDADTKIQPGTQGCDAPEGSDCLRVITLLGTPALWWGGCLALIAAAALWLGTRDWRYGVAVVGTLSTWLPWLQYDDRPIFIFYAVITVPFMVMAITLLMGGMLGRYDRPDAAPYRRGDRLGRLLRPGPAELRLVLAGLHRPAAHPPRVARPDLVLPLDLTRPVAGNDPDLVPTGHRDHSRPGQSF